MQTNQQVILVVTLAIFVLIGLSALADWPGRVFARAVLLLLLPAAVAGFLAGAARVRFPRAPVVAAVIVVLACGACVAGEFAYARWAEECEREQCETQLYASFFRLILYPVAAGIALLSIWAGVRVSERLQASMWRGMPEREAQRAENAPGAAREDSQNAP